MKKKHTHTNFARCLKFGIKIIYTSCGISPKPILLTLIKYITAILEMKILQNISQ